MANNINLTPTLTFNGNTLNEKTVGSIVELLVKRIITNNAYFDLEFVSTLAAENVSNFGGFSTALYRLPQRLTWGIKYDLETGAVRQRPGSKYETVQLDRMMNIKLMIEEYDLSKLKNANPAVRSGLLGEWISSLTNNLLMNKGAILRQAIKDYCIAHYNKNDAVPSVLVIDKSKLTTKDDVENFFINLLNVMTKKQKMINKYMVGTNKEDWSLSFSYELYNRCLKGFTQFIDTTGARALTSGQWFENNAIGYSFYKDIFLNEVFAKNGEGAINNDKSFDLSGVDGMIVLKNDWVAPDNFEYLRTMPDPNTGNDQWIGKYAYALPMSIYGASMIFMDHEPTADEIAKAKAKCWVQGTTHASDFSENVQLSIYDPIANNKPKPPIERLADYITVTELGQITDNTNLTIIAAVVAKNPKASSLNLTVNDASTTQAIIKSSISGNDSIVVKFTIKPSTKK